jgi:hypothetical protein
MLIEEVGSKIDRDEFESESTRAYLVDQAVAFSPSVGAEILLGVRRVTRICDRSPRSRSHSPLGYAHHRFRGLGMHASEQCRRDLTSQGLRP